MFIKEITVSGFKSYKDKTVVDELDPGFNVIVGRNGSGKSNLFAAIEFALTLEYRNLRPQARSALLHHGMANYDAAFVEIVFDNSDRKLPVNSDTVAFRRLIAAKKDRFYCNGKELSNAKQFLDIAGLTNPYFIVKQGKVQQLAVGTDSFRLKLLEDVTGSTSYEEKLLDCRRDLSDGDTKREEIEKCMGGLQTRQRSLQEEVKELKNYLRWDSKRRIIEHILNDREQECARRALIKCDEDRAKLNEQQEPLQKEWQEFKREYDSVIRKISEVTDELHSVQLKKEAIEGEILSLVSEQERLKNFRADLLNKDNETSSKKKANAELKKLKKDLDTAESDLKAAKKELEVAKSEESDVEMRLISKESKLKVLECRLAGSNEFGNNKEMKKLVSTIETDISSNSNKRDGLTKLVASQERLKTETSGELQKIHEEYNSIRTELSKLQKEANKPDAELFKAENSRKKMWKNLNENEQKTANEKGARLAVMELLRKRVGRATVNGWESVRTAVEELRNNGENDIVDGYYGLVIENINCEDTYDLSVEAAAGNMLFHHIVKNHVVSMRIMRVFNKLKLKGAPSFIPIDELHVRNVNCPAAHRDFRPLINNIDFPAELENVKRYIFGPVLLCRELSIASTMAKTHKLTCVTTEGDKVASNGPITGGYLEAQLGQLELQRGLSKLNASLQTLVAEKLEIEQELERLNDYISKAGKDAQTRENKKCALMAQHDASSLRMKSSQEFFKSKEVSIANGQAEIDRLTRVIHELECRKTNYKAESTSNNSSQSDRKTASELRKEVKKLMKEKQKTFSVKMEKEKTVGSLTQKIQQLITCVDEENFKSLELHSSQEHRKMLQELDEMMDSASEHISQKKKECDEVEKNIVSLTRQSNQVRLLLEGLQDRKKELRISRDKVEKSLHKLCTIYAGLTQKLGDILKAASALGTMPSDAGVRAKQMELSSKELYAKLNKLNKYINGIQDINQKAVDQYKELSENYESFKEKFEHLSQAKLDLEQLIQDLEAKRGDAILQNFLVLQEQFQSIFSQIVPKGVAKLILYGNNFEVEDDSADSDEIRQLIGSREAQGVKINVNFINQRLPEMSNLIQLSGGQKSVVALCLILAIQKIDPVPFYLFDEVDQALDAQYRSAVTRVIHGLAKDFHLQFICTTFRKEFLTNADKFYGVSIMNQYSTVKPVTSLEAKDFVENDSVNGSGGSANDDIVMTEQPDSELSRRRGRSSEDDVFSQASAAGSEMDQGDAGSIAGSIAFTRSSSSSVEDDTDDEVLSTRFKRVRLNQRPTRRPTPPLFSSPE